MYYKLLVYATVSPTHLNLSTVNRKQMTNFLHFSQIMHTFHPKNVSLKQQKGFSF